MSSHPQPASSFGEQAAATPENHRQSLLSIVGIALPFVAGTMVWWVPALWGRADIFDAPAPLYIVFVGTIVLAFAGAVLLGTNWSLLIVPVAWIVGEALTLLVIGMFGVVGVTWEIVWGSTSVFVSLATLPLMIAASLGILFRRWLERRRH